MSCTEELQSPPRGNPQERMVIEGAILFAKTKRGEKDAVGGGKEGGESLGQERGKGLASKEGRIRYEVGSLKKETARQGTSLKNRY